MCCGVCTRSSVLLVYFFFVAGVQGFFAHGAAARPQVDADSAARAGAAGAAAGDGRDARTAALEARAGRQRSRSPTKYANH